MEHQYKTAFEIGVRSFPWSMFLHPFIGIVLGALVFRFAKQGLFRIFGAVVAGLAALILLVGPMQLVPEFFSLRNDYKQGKDSVVEGTVENFNPAPDLGPSRESFSVHGVGFSYNALDATPCFHNAPIHKGPIRAGLQVRIYYKGPCVHRVDVLEPQPVTVH